MKNFFTVLIFLALATNTFAQGNRGETNMDIYYGAADLDDYGSLDPNDDSMWGIRAGYSLSDDWGIELTGQWMDLDSTLGAADLTSLRANVLYNFRAYKPVRPYVTVGLGLEQLEIMGDDELDFSLNAGGGVRWYVIDHFGVRADARVVSSESGAELVTVGGKGKESVVWQMDKRRPAPRSFTQVNFISDTQTNIEGSVGVFLVF